MLTLTSSIDAREPRSSTEPDVLQQPAAIVDVARGFGGRGESTDFRLSLGYQQTWRRGTLEREEVQPLLAGQAVGGIVRREVADYAQNVSRLHVRTELGLYEDFSVELHVPVILSDERTLQAAGGGGTGPLSAASGEALFSLPFRSPNRSGVEYVGVGLNVGPMRQGHLPQRPNLKLGLEVRFGVSEPMRACSGGADPTCPHPGDIDGDGTTGGFPFEVAPGRIESLESAAVDGVRAPGVGRGTTALRLHAAASRRYGAFEPYVSLELLAERGHESSEFGADGAHGAGPPMRGTFLVGTELMPWEVAEQFQRFSLDLQVSGTFVSAGRDYSPLFDALGSSSALALRLPRFADYRANPDPTTNDAFPSVVDPASERSFVTGITSVEAHATGTFRLTAKWQAGRYVRFHLGGSLTLTQPHFITHAAECDPDRGVLPEQAGPCAATDAAAPAGAPDPTFRAEIDLPGRRFRIQGERTVDAWVSATVMF